MPLISVVIPVYRDTGAVIDALEATNFDGCEVIVASTPDDRESLARIRSLRRDVIWVECDRGRARQMNAGARAAHGRWLIFLHADTRLASGWQDELAAIDPDKALIWGCFRFALGSTARTARVIESGVRLRLRMLELPYGDQAIFVRHAVFDELGGYADLPLMEDVELVRRLRRRGRLFQSELTATTSARRWERDGWIRRSAINVLVLAAYFCGVRPDRLNRLYNREHGNQARSRHPQL